MIVAGYYSFMFLVPYFIFTVYCLFFFSYRRTGGSSYCCNSDWFLYSRGDNNGRTVCHVCLAGGGTYGCCSGTDATGYSFYPKYSETLTLKAPRKTASENVVCLCRLLNILADFSNLFYHTGKQCGP